MAAIEDRLPLIGVTIFVGLSLTGAYLEPAQIAKGQQLYGEKRCSRCHTVEGEGGKIGPDLSRVGAKRKIEWLLKFLKNPKAVNPKAKMEPFDGPDQALEALAAYLSTLQ